MGQPRREHAARQEVFCLARCAASDKRSRRLGPSRVRVTGLDLHCASSFEKCSIQRSCIRTLSKNTLSLPANQGTFHYSTRTFPRTKIAVGGGWGCRVHLFPRNPDVHGNQTLQSQSCIKAEASHLPSHQSFAPCAHSIHIKLARNHSSNYWRLPMFRSFAVVLLIAVTLSFIYPTLEAPILVKRIINSTTATISTLPSWRLNNQDITERGNRIEDSEIEDFRHRPSPPSDTAPSRGWEPIYMPQEPQAPQAVAREADVDRETFSSHPNSGQPNPPSRGWEPVYKPASDDEQQPIAKREEPENPAVAKFLQRQRQIPVPPPEEDPSYNAQQPIVSEQQQQKANEGPGIDAFKQRPSEPTPNPPSRGWAPVYKPSGEHSADM